jgi:hypothetical protein
LTFAPRASAEGVKHRFTPRAASASFAAAQKLTMTNGVAAFYTAGTPASDYYIILSNSASAAYNSQTGAITGVTDAYIATFDFYAEGTTDELPSGTYKSADSYEAMTFDPEFSTLRHIGLDGAADLEVAFSAPVSVSRSTDGTYTITTTVTLGGVETDFSFTGKIPLGASSSSTYPSFKRDADLTMTGGQAYYYGNLMDNHTGNYIVRLFDCEYTDSGNILSNSGICLNLMFFTKYLSKDVTKYIEPGTYTFGRSLARGTIFPGMEVDYLEQTVPYGSYICERSSSYTGSYGYGYLISGTLTVERTEAASGDTYTFTLDAQTDLSYNIKATYTGKLSFIDNATYSSGGLVSTLVDDVEMDLSPIKTSRVYNGGTFTNQNGVTVQSFVLDIGSPSGLDCGTVDNPTGVGDIIRMEFLLPEGTSQVQPGTYTVLDNDYYQYYEPYTLRQGYFSKKGTGELVGTRYNHFQTGRWLIFDEYAPAESGTVGVTKNADDTYTFNIFLVDDGGFYITGSWTGPMSLKYDPSTITAVSRVGSDNVVLRPMGAKRYAFSAPVCWSAYSLQGAKVAEGTDTTEADLTDLASGIYILHYDNLTQKIIIR